MAEGLGHQVDGTADGGGAVESAPRAALDLDILQACRQVRHVKPVHVMIFRIVLGDSVDHHGDPARVEAADGEIGVAYAVPRFRVDRGGRELREEHRKILGRLPFADLRPGERAEAGRCRSLPSPGRAHCDGLNLHR